MMLTKLTHFVYRNSVWPYPAWYACCVVFDVYERPNNLNYKMQNYAVDHGIVFG